MYRLLNNRKALIAVAIAVAFVAVVIPTCRMVGCSMDMGSMGAMSMMNMGAGLGMSSTCDGEYLTTSTPLAVVPLGAESLVLTLLAAVMAAVVLFSPQMVSRPVLIVDAAPPPPPEDPLGARFRV
jgi:hypothetical protein